MISMHPIGYVSSCYQEKFGIPRQPGLVPAAKATLQLLPDYANPDTVRGLEDFSHLWLVFMFHATADQGWKPTVRPPRLGGNARLGVFATRSMFRPNSVGLSVVSLEAVRIASDSVILELGGVDLLDGTPVLDIKPYLPYADSLDGASGGFASSAPVAVCQVTFSDTALGQCAVKSQKLQVDIGALIAQTLQQDPRPSYRRDAVDDKVYVMRLYDFDVRWRCRVDNIEVLELANT